MTQTEIHEEALRRGQIRHALKTALACCLATALTHLFHLASGVFAPIFAFMLMTLGMPSPRQSALLGQFALVVSGLVSALLVIAFHDAPALYLGTTLLWIFICLLFTNWYPLPASMGSMVSAIGLFTFFGGSVGETFSFYVEFAEDWVAGGFSVVVVTTLIWPQTAEKARVQQLPSASRKRLIDANSLRASTKLVLILALCLVEEHVLGFTGGIQVAFFATFFASVGNLGRQAKTNLLGLAGVLAAAVFGIAAAYLTSKLPRFPLLLSLEFLGEFLAILAFQRLPRYGVAGLQGGLALPFAFLNSAGPDWGTFAGARIRIAGIIVAGFTALVVHACLWPVLPMRRLRALIAAALRDTAVSLDQLLSGPRSTWQGSPPSLHNVVTQARDLLDDAGYLPGRDGADSDYHDILGCIQEIDACLEHVNVLVAREEDRALRQRFFQVTGDYAAQAGNKLETVAQQFQESAGGAADVEPVRWQSDVTARWQSASPDFGPVPDGDLDPWQPAAIARCLDQIARAVETISGIVLEINARIVGY